VVSVIRRDGGHARERRRSESGRNSNLTSRMMTSIFIVTDRINQVPEGARSACPAWKTREGKNKLGGQ
jgi:hypothetical protein